MSLNPKTVRLSAGRHRSPEHGVCVLELSSMLAGEAFSDRPDGVCPVVGAFLRGVNDRLDDGRRQRLLRLAADVVGSRTGDPRTEDLRAALCLVMTGDSQRTGVGDPLLRVELAGWRTADRDDAEDRVEEVVRALLDVRRRVTPRPPARARGLVPA